MEAIPVKQTQIAILEDNCVGCGECVKYCPMSVFEVVNRKAVPIQQDICLECGTCIRNCPEKAIRIAGLDEEGITIKEQSHITH